MELVVILIIIPIVILIGLNVKKDKRKLRKAVFEHAYYQSLAYWMVIRNYVHMKRLY